MPLEQYTHHGDGYLPFLIREGWQVAILNYEEAQLVEQIKKMDVHFETDEVFVLLKGDCVLITADIDETRYDFHVEKMKEHVVYNVPKNCWHNIAMQPGSSVLIVEKDNTHLGDFAFNHFSEEKHQQLIQMVQEMQEA